MTNYYHRHM